MSKRANIYTRTGDSGTTDLLGGSRVEKDSLRVEAYGTVDELCAIISVVKAAGADERIVAFLSELQTDFYAINAEIAADENGRLMLTKTVQQSDVERLERLIDEFDAMLPKLMHFIVPVETQAAAFLNLARTVCRRAERRLWALSRIDDVNPHLIKFFNRLSDLLFTLMRVEGQRIQPGAEIPIKHSEKAES